MEMLANPCTGALETCFCINVSKYMNIEPVQSRALRSHPEPMVCFIYHPTDRIWMPQLIRMNHHRLGFAAQYIKYWCHFSTPDWSWMQFASQPPPPEWARRNRGTMPLSSRCSLYFGLSDPTLYNAHQLDMIITEIKTS